MVIYAVLFAMLLKKREQDLDIITREADNAVNHTDEDIPLAFLSKKAYINISQKCVLAHFCRKERQT